MATSPPKIVVIGAGCGGITFAIGLKHKLGFHNFTIYERGPTLGGTWRENVYPGCSSDVPMHFFSLSTDLHDWPSTHGLQDEIFEYWHHLGNKYDIGQHIVFNHQVVAAEWDDQKQLHRISLKNTISGETSETEAQILISATGVLDIPRWPDYPGLDSFKGTIFHSARWEKDVSLKGKRVAVIGNGPSAIQFVPKISEDLTTNVINFCRTPSWVIPSMRHKYPTTFRWLLRNVPGLIRLVRLGYFLQFELAYWLVFSNSVTRRFLQQLSKLYMLSAAPVKYHDKILPKHQLGCKRLLFDTGYLESLHRPNVSICWDGIKEIVDDGIITTNEEKQTFDVIILATGFMADAFATTIRGRNQQTVNEYYKASGGPKAYLGTSMPGFPNFYTLFGPNTATGHTSVIYSLEIQTDYVLQLIKPVLENKVSSFEVKAAAADEYNEKIHNKLASSVFVQCVSWYRTGGNGKITNIFPGPAMLFWWWLRKPIWNHYVAFNGQKWQAERRAHTRTFLIRAAALALLALGISYSGFKGTRETFSKLLPFSNSI
ncbi:hypothetical protein AMATHDRAFT_54678 [Amanita thiersii Skay4041]|uniref:Uncharacterized protein n=1 Tax=Amanita thiersii Skay4041 TaxID=703135 RepID=A0A2A9NZU8_9AGAR|nr:hypothetical protein AMATHDRAFT_54678 [Amanita thiersii Skay4041]